MSFQDSWWNISVSSSVILAASVFRYRAGKKTDRHTIAAENPNSATAVGAGNDNNNNNNNNNNGQRLLSARDL